MDKTCSRCGEQKPLGEFYKDPRSEGTLAHCKVCLRAQSLAWRRRNPQRKKQQAREWYVKARSRPKTAAVSPRVCTGCGESKPLSEYHRQVDSSDGFKRQCKPCANAVVARIRKGTAGRIHSQQKRARRRKAAGSCSSRQLEARWAYYADKCWMCGDDATQTDHVIPLIEGGSNWPANLRPACKPCNLRKGRRMPKEVQPWRASCR